MQSTGDILMRLFTQTRSNPVLLGEIIPSSSSSPPSALLWPEAAQSWTGGLVPVGVHLYIYIYSKCISSPVTLGLFFFFAARSVNSHLSAPSPG